ncbi:cell division protein FtsQ/DivIB [Microbulbifer thermotolerans]|uniref:Cell division protein FtsQ n=1 Tax=Microbulbifer thermotolerans TaxID=252514 RepID=A0AB35HVG8_MICTH|nr:FtsQ-type POTRA domain-containing protein [Microbulbifer thermotolerans]MCX2780746.1 FtsQ-type POTRA domain-containing protein [Microbulbifer thermotolerans]MCX2800642.1 FtsQ-type POTRA domain-containing protein [Microbulbifer thermotolerans]MCX2806455.1 FtsQ-type POTRA domain-containing protein [Microbulbifer thermotolerans]MCX2841566.1 FtsQ-type POTRA domain-containing protein [Microbulbifer thermotolerans]WKT61617.1 FtsQ-type POTRA domain-containing protein [Microbulbifer thermotolerans]
MRKPERAYRGRKTKLRGARRIANRVDGTSRNWRPLLVAVLAIVTLAGISYGGLWLWRSPLGELSRIDSLEQVRVKGPFNAVTQRQIEETLLPFLQKGFFSADIRGMREALLRNPWITSASVSRRWPRGVEVEVREAQPLAVWGEDKLLVASGELLPRPAQMRTGHLPELAGDEELVERIVTQYQALARLLTTRDMEVKRLTFDELSGWQLELVSGVELHLGHEELLERVDRFLQLSRGLLAPHLAKVRRVDTRYSNAVAVQWKQN